MEREDLGKDMRLLAAAKLIRLRKWFNLQDLFPSIGEVPNNRLTLGEEGAARIRYGTWNDPVQL